MIDTPGMRELQLWDDDGGWAEAFSDIEELAKACRFSDCRHQQEAGCAVREALRTGQLERKRLDNYLKTQRELKFQAAKEQSRQRAAKAGAGKSAAKAGSGKGGAPRGKGAAPAVCAGVGVVGSWLMGGIDFREISRQSQLAIHSYGVNDPASLRPGSPVFR